MSDRATSDRQRGSGLPHWWTLTRDIASFLGGWTLIFTEVQRDTLRESVLVLAAGIVGVPAAAIGAQTVVDAISARRSGTEPPSSPRVEAAPSPPSSPP